MMRVRYLQTYLSDGGLLQESDLKTLRCMRVGIQAAHWLRLLGPLRDPLGEALGGGVSPSSLIAILTEQLHLFQQHGIVPTFVFDGVVPLPRHTSFSAHRQHHIEEAWLLYASQQLARLRECQQEHTQQQPCRQRRLLLHRRAISDRGGCSLAEAPSEVETTRVRRRRRRRDRRRRRTRRESSSSGGTSSSDTSRQDAAQARERSRCSERPREEEDGDDDSEEDEREEKQRRDAARGDGSGRRQRSPGDASSKERTQVAEKEGEKDDGEEPREEAGRRRQDEKADEGSRGVAGRRRSPEKVREEKHETGRREGNDTDQKEEDRDAAERRAQTKEENTEQTDTEEENLDAFSVCCGARTSSDNATERNVVLLNSKSSSSTCPSATADSSSSSFSASHCGCAILDDLGQQIQSSSCGLRGRRGSSSGSSGSSGGRAERDSSGSVAAAKNVVVCCANSSRHSHSTISSGRKIRGDRESFLSSSSNSSSNSRTSSHSTSSGAKQPPVCPQSFLCVRSTGSRPGSSSTGQSSPFLSSSPSSSSAGPCTNNSSSSNSSLTLDAPCPSHSRCSARATSHSSSGSTSTVVTPTTSTHPPHISVLTSSSSSSSSSFATCPSSSSSSCSSSASCPSHCPHASPSSRPPLSPSSHFHYPAPPPPLPPASSSLSCHSCSSASASSSCGCCCVCAWPSCAAGSLSSSTYSETLAEKFLQGSSRVTSEVLLFTFHFLKSRGISCVCAPSLAAAQLAYWEKQGVFEAVLGTPALLLFGATRVLLQIDWRRSTFRWVDQHQLLQLCGVSSAQFLDACLLAGTDYCKTFPLLNLPAFHHPYSSHFSFRTALECAKQAPLLAYVQQCPTEQMRNEQYEGYCFCKTLVKYPLVLQVSAVVAPLLRHNQQQQDVHTQGQQCLSSEEQQQQQRPVQQQQHLSLRASQQRLPVQQQHQQLAGVQEQQQQQQCGAVPPPSASQRVCSSAFAWPSCSSSVVPHFFGSSSAPAGGERLPRDYSRVAGRRLPLHFYFLMMEGILSQDLLAAFAFEQWNGNRPPCADSVEYRDILTEVREYTCTALSMLAAYLHLDFQKRPIRFSLYQPCSLPPAGNTLTLQPQQQEVDRQQRDCAGNSNSCGGDSSSSSDSSATKSSGSTSSTPSPGSNSSHPSSSRSSNHSSAVVGCASSAGVGVCSSSSNSPSHMQAYLLSPERSPNRRRRWYVDALNVQEEMERQQTHRVDLPFCLRWHAHAFHQKHLHRLCENCPAAFRVTLGAAAAAAPDAPLPPPPPPSSHVSPPFEIAAASPASSYFAVGRSPPAAAAASDSEAAAGAPSAAHSRPQPPQSCNSVLAAAHFLLLDALGFFSERLEPTVFGEALMQTPPQFQEEVLVFLELLKTGLVNGNAYEPPVDRLYARQISALLLLKSEAPDAEREQQQPSNEEQQQQHQQQHTSYQRREQQSTEQQQKQKQQNSGGEQHDMSAVTQAGLLTQQQEPQQQEPQQQEPQQQEDPEEEQTRQQRVLLLSRLCSLLPMQLHPHACWKGEDLSFELTAFSCVAGVIKKALRHIAEASISSVLLQDMQQLRLLPSNLFSPVNALLPTFLLPRNCMGIVMQFLLEYKFPKGDEQDSEEKVDVADEEQQAETQRLHEEAAPGKRHALCGGRAAQEAQAEENDEKREQGGKREGRRGSALKESEEIQAGGGRRTRDAEDDGAAALAQEEKLQKKGHVEHADEQQQKEPNEEEGGHSSNSSNKWGVNCCAKNVQLQAQAASETSNRHNLEHKRDKREGTPAAAAARLRNFEEVLQQQFPCCIDPVGDLCVAVQFWTEVCAAVDRIDDFVDAAALVKKIDAATDLLVLQCTRAGLHAHPRFPIHAFDVIR